MQIVAKLARRFFAFQMRRINEMPTRNAENIAHMLSGMILVITTLVLATVFLAKPFSLTPQLLGYWLLFSLAFGGLFLRLPLQFTAVLRLQSGSWVKRSVATALALVLLHLSLTFVYIAYSWGRPWMLTGIKGVFDPWLHIAMFTSLLFARYLALKLHNWLLPKLDLPSLSSIAGSVLGKLNPKS